MNTVNNNKISVLSIRRVFRPGKLLPLCVTQVTIFVGKFIYKLGNPRGAMCFPGVNSMQGMLGIGN